MHVYRSSFFDPLSVYTRFSDYYYYYYYYIINFSVSIVRTLRVYSNIKKRNFYTLYFYTLYLLQLLDYTWFVLSHKTHYVY